MRRFGAEFLGTLLLVFFGVGSAVFGIGDFGATGVALAFGFVLIGLIQTFGPISGCHINPAITLGMLVSGRISFADAAKYVLTQVAGGIAGAFLLWAIVKGGDVTDTTEHLGANNYGTSINVGGALAVEIVLTFLLVFIVIAVTSRSENAALAGLTIGTALVVIHLVGIPLTGTSVNPARSIGPALFDGGDSIKHLWLFIVAPLVGGVLAGLMWPLFEGKEPERQMVEVSDLPETE